MSLVDFIPKLQELSRADQLQVIQFWASGLLKKETISLLKNGRTYEVSSPDDAFEAVEIRGKMLEENQVN